MAKSNAGVANNSLDAQARATQFMRSALDILGETGRTEFTVLEVVERSKEILARLEDLTLDAADRPKIARKPAPGALQQLALFSAPKKPPAAKPDPLRKELSRLDPEAITPLEALKKLHQWKKRYGDPKPGK